MTPPAGGQPAEGSGDVVEIADRDTVWRFDAPFLRSNWTCIWGRGCLGILPAPAEELGQGCCSVGAELDGEDEARRIAALAATLPPERFEHHPAARAGGVFSDSSRTSTRVVDGACIFLNRPGFAGGAGCALHLDAVAEGESPIDAKPSVCWQLPIKVDVEGDDGGPEVATVRRWSRRDWGGEGEEMAWCCTEGDRAYVGARPVVDSLRDELETLVGPAVYVELRRRLTGVASTAGDVLRQRDPDGTPGIEPGAEKERPMPRTIRLKTIDEPAAGTRAVIDLQSEAFLSGQVATGTSAGLLEQLCGLCERVLVKGRPHLKQDDAGNPVVLRCAFCRAFNEMTQD